MHYEKVSVLMPLKKADPFFWKAFNSILDQTYKNIEIIIIVDKPYVQEIKNLLQNKNIGNVDIKILGSGIAGIAPALNLGIQQSSGVYIARMDADDISFPERFEKQINYLKNNEECKILGTRAKYINKFGNELSASKNNGKKIYKIMCYRNVITHPTVMMRANFVKDLGGYSNTASEDYELWLRCLAVKRNSISILDEELLFYRLHENQISNITRFKSQAAVCVAIFSLLCIRFDANLLFGLIFNLAKLGVRKLNL